MTLRIFERDSGESVGGSVRVENGYPSFAVDGQCQYFISGGWRGSGAPGLDYGWRRGSVDPDLRRTLERMAGTENLSSLDDCDPQQGVPDAGALVIANTRSTLTCEGREGRRVAAVFDAIDDLSRRLWQDGQALDQGLRVTASAGSAPIELPPYAWPSELSLGDYLGVGSTVPTDEQSELVPAAQAAPLRLLREQYLSDIRETPTWDDGQGIPVSDGERSVRLFMRDALPYEDERGLWPIPGE